ncbi:hypothetical protein HMPREF0578_1923 [Mobiluncus mulieris 28-1]|uniref:Uncharacterized protein n=1 Tax=Mobiluncus mulieris ATCC 35239 TaxID=871571 RepID=E0QSL0_9ACTO|nr:hypothetical protein HMPREF0578_1923 [Mobiluncus mulieris 28-1]EFM45460.1 hypothetical protein HMPREF0580_1875 [Mobiluncus mulieris ATCC 35239]
MGYTGLGVPKSGDFAQKTLDFEPPGAFSPDCGTRFSFYQPPFPEFCT